MKYPETSLAHNRKSINIAVIDEINAKIKSNRGIFRVEIEKRKKGRQLVAF
jgi:hypothetical protein